MALQVRQACLADLPSIYRGEESYIRSWEPAHETSWRADFGRHLTRWVENFDHLKVAVVGDNLAGYSLWIPEGAKAELSTIHVVPAYRRSGVGMALLEEYSQDAARQGFAQLQLSVRPENPAKFLYQKAGFVCVGTGAHGYLMYERHA